MLSEPDSLPEVLLYMDVHVPFAVTRELRKRSVDVVTARQDGCQQLVDRDLLIRATTLSRVLFSQDSDLLREATLTLRSNERFVGVVFAPQLTVSVGQMVSDLELLVRATSSDEWQSRIEYLPLR